MHREVKEQPEVTRLGSGRARTRTGKVRPSLLPQMVPVLLQSREGSEGLHPDPLFTQASHLSTLFSSPAKSGSRPEIERKLRSL